MWAAGSALGQGTELQMLGEQSCRAPSAAEGSRGSAHPPAGLTPCSESKAFAKLEKKEIKALTKRLKQVRGGAADGAWAEGSACAGGAQRLIAAPIGRLSLAHCQALMSALCCQRWCGAGERAV